ncbi:hypothetical protein ACS0TY_000352 [Phlomoides rotata]
MDFDYARYMLTGGGKENRVASSQAYRKLLEEALSLNRSRILAFRNKPPTRAGMKMAELTGHTSPVLYMAQSPDGCTVASAAGDETLRFWNVFEMPQVAKPKTTAPEPFAHVSRIR